ncbi:MAG: DUF5615 family PIN-like protein [Anaerolineae bacterium]|nr:DUF5615 family PIN-like protein [Anaerolineae bacterium]
MKFLADMGISPVTVQFLRDQGFDAVHLSDSRLHRLPDPEIITKARNENRIILTHDLEPIRKIFWTMEVKHKVASRNAS